MDKTIVIGDGMFGSKFSGFDFGDVVLFCSGVSNSQETRILSFMREQSLLEKTILDNKNKVIVYFSSYIAHSGTGLYAEHKRRIESLIEQKAAEFLILRLPQVVGLAKNDTLVRFLVKSIVLNKTIKIYKDAIRTLIDIDDVVRILEFFLSNSIRKKITVGSKNSLNVIDILHYIEGKLKLNSKVQLIEGGDVQQLDLSEFFNYIGNNDILCNINYPYYVLEKYVYQLAEQICIESGETAFCGKP